MTDTLADQLAHRLGIPPEEARQALEEVVGDLREQIEREGEAALPGLGTLRLHHGQFAFEPSEPFAKAVNHRFAGLDPVVVRAAAPEEAEDASGLEELPEDIQAAAVAEALREITTTSEASEEAVPLAAAADAVDEPVEEAAYVDEAEEADLAETEEAPAPLSPEEEPAPVLAAADEPEGADEAFVEEDPFEIPEEADAVGAAALAMDDEGTDEADETVSEQLAPEDDLSPEMPPEPSYEAAAFEELEASVAPSFPVEDPDEAASASVGALSEEDDFEPAFADEPVAEVAPDWEATPEELDRPLSPLDNIAAEADLEDTYEAEIAAYAAAMASAGAPAPPDETPVQPALPEPALASAPTERAAPDRAAAAPRARDERKSPVGWIVGLVVLLAVVAVLWFVLGRDGKPEPAAPVVAEEQLAPLPAAADTLAADLPAEALAAEASEEGPAETPAQPEATPPPVAPAPSSRSIDRARGGYTVVVGSQSTRPDAEQMMQQMQQRAALNEYPVDVLVGQSGGSTRYRVGVGQFASIEAADQARRRHAGALPQGAWVLRIQSDM